jgi:ethanolaminephosphotransferase
MRPHILLLVANALLPIAIWIFAKGFFPYKPFLPGFASHNEDTHPLSAPFDKVIFMVVDALRRQVPQGTAFYTYD